MIDEILDAHRIGDGRYQPDLVMIHDGNYPLLKRYIEGKSIKFPTDRIIAVADHFSPPSKVVHAGYLRDFESFVHENGIEYHRFNGISHALMMEYAKKGMFIVGLDSHSTAYGGTGALSIGSGAMDMAHILLKGDIWLESPEIKRVRVKSGMSGFDTGLHLIRKGYDGLWLELEWDSDMDERTTMATMAADAGAVSALFTDIREGELLEAQGHLIAPPGDLRNPVPLNKYAGKKVHQAFIGSCMGGRIGDLRKAADVLDGRKAKARLLVSPVSMKAYLQALKEGIMETLVDSGAVILNPSCGTCAGIDKGMLSPEERGVFTTTRNAKGRHGGPVFSASPEVAAVSALLGRIPTEGEVNDIG